MTVQDLQEQIQVIYEGDNEFITTTTDEDWQIRLSLINMAILEWEATPNILWRELVRTAQKTGFDCPSDFARMFNGSVKVGTTKVQEVSPEKLLDYDGQSTTYFAVFGSKATGFSLKFVNLDLDDEQTLTYTYIKQADLMAASSDIPELSDPAYIVHRVVSGLYDHDSDPKATRELAFAQSLLSDMIVKNATLSWGGKQTYTIG